jgi:UDP-2-acetamido-2,6-beta-L-arabino-hexul-4-ose reductase
VKTVLITGAAGFIGRNLRQALERQPDVTLRLFTSSDSPEQLDGALREAEVIYHLAGVNRPQTEAEFTAVNVGFTREICAKLRDAGRAPRIVFASSVQAAGNSAYGQSKQAAEEELRAFKAASGAEVVIYRLKNVFGRWCRPGYNSVVATFCHNIARGLPIQISDPDRELELVYIDDVVTALASELSSADALREWGEVPCSHWVTLGQLSEMIQAFQASRSSLVMPDLSNPFAKKLYATFLSYLPEHEFAYSLVKREDNRGELAEFIKSYPFGQIFVSRTKPGITRGNHYHLQKAEKFLVIEGDAVIRFRHIERDDVLEYPVCGRDLRVVDIPPGYTHSIENVGTTEMIVLFWASDVFDPQRPDTYFSDVLRSQEGRHEGSHHRRHAA